MAWDTEWPLKLRYVINDLTSGWTDNQLKSFLIISFDQVRDGLQKWGIGGPYTVNFTNLTITPDPADPTGAPIGLGNLTILKAACTIARAETKKELASAGFKITDDKSSVDTTNRIGSLKEGTKTMCEAYEEALKEFKEGNRYAGLGILGPYSSSDGPVYPWPVYENDRGVGNVY